ncbi:MAG TPA: intradiol ring-cleavage dioxygenase [Cyclobacteriaceae bacterium]|nr:intradiol ring-cleavage dioxygenase [Cyclobacteriaceae bacterium]
MDRNEFLKKLGLTTMVMPLFSACSKDDDPTDVDTSNNNGACNTTPSETEGPFPTKNPATLALGDITSDRTGVPMVIAIVVKDKNDNCTPLQGAIVDIWHCDKDGNYSEYGGSGMQSANYSSVHFLRGRQTANSQGAVGFGSIFPGWYSGRAPHIHVHVYNPSGKTLLVTQIAFPKEVCDNVYTNSNIYSSRGRQDTTNESDNVFRDGVINELAVVEGSVGGGYTLTHTIVVEA